MSSATSCQFCEKECPVLNKDIEVTECSLVFILEDGNRECAFSLIARNLDAIYTMLKEDRVLLQKWLKKGLKARK
jgi:hypothetical protein